MCRYAMGTGGSGLDASTLPGYRLRLRHSHSTVDLNKKEVYN